MTWKATWYEHDRAADVAKNNSAVAERDRKWSGREWSNSWGDTTEGWDTGTWVPSAAPTDPVDTRGGNEIDDKRVYLWWLERSKM